MRFFEIGRIGWHMKFYFINYNESSKNSHSERSEESLFSPPRMLLSQSGISMTPNHEIHKILSKSYY